MTTICENCPYLATTGCTITYICGIPKCARELDGKTYATNTTEGEERKKQREKNYKKPHSFKWGATEQADSGELTDYLE